MSSRIGIVAFIASMQVVHAAAGTRVSLETVLRALNEQGYNIVFSSDLVGADLYLDGAEISFDAVRRQLPALGLSLRGRGDTWLVVPARAAPRQETTVGPDPPLPPPAIETVIVTGTRHRLPRDSTASMTLSPEDLNAPALAGDTLRVVNRLPGVASVGVSARPRIRGGLRDEVLVMMDGVEILEPYHLADFQSIFSAIDGRTVDAVDIYTGGFPVRYGNAMSGVIEVSTLEQLDKPGAEVGISTLALLANARGHTTRGDIDWLASARRSNLGLLIDGINGDFGVPRYFDTHLRLGRRRDDAPDLFVGAFAMRDEAELADDEETAASHVDSRYLWARIDVDHGPALASSTVLSAVTFERDRRQFSPADGEDSEGFLDYEHTTRAIELRTDLSKGIGRHRMELGLQAEYASAEYDSRAVIDRGALNRLTGNTAGDGHDIHVDPRGWSGGLYWSGEFALGDRLTVVPGIRWDFQAYDRTRHFTDQVSPRLGLRYTRPGLVARLTVGRFHQPEAIHEMQVADGVDHFFAPQRADHVVMGLEWRPAADFALRVEAYRKRYEHTRPRFENLFNPFVLLPELEGDRVELTPRGARVRGAEIEASGRFFAHGSATLSYGYLDAEDRLETGWVPRRWSQRHTVHSMVSWQRERWGLSAAVTWHSGWYATRPPALLPDDQEVAVSDFINNHTLDDYVSLDVSARRTWRLGRSRITVRLDVTNVLDHDNAAGIDYDVEQADDAVVFVPDRETLLPIIPSIGILISF